MSRSLEDVALGYAALLTEISDITMEMAAHPCERRVDRDHPACWMFNTTPYDQGDEWQGAIPLEERCDACKLTYPLAAARRKLRQRKGGMTLALINAYRARLHILSTLTLGEPHGDAGQTPFDESELESRKP